MVQQKFGFHLHFMGMILFRLFVLLPAPKGGTAILGGGLVALICAGVLGAGVAALVGAFDCLGGATAGFGAGVAAFTGVFFWKLSTRVSEPASLKRPASGRNSMLFTRMRE